MKSKIILLILFLLVINVSAQYNPQLIDTTKHWSISHQPGCMGVLYTYYIKFNGDTLINSTVYTKILKSYDEFMEEWELYGFIREEDNKYYFRNLISEEGLVYDFNVNIGDTIEINNPFGFIPIQTAVTNIDSVFIEPENEYRKRISLIEFAYYGYEYWIEGIGSLSGITESSSDLTMLTGGDNYTLFCYYENEELLYKMNMTILCFYPIVGIPAKNQIENNIHLFPNPVKNISHIIFEYPDQHNLTIRIFNSTGNVVEEYKVTTPNRIRINSINYPKGVYFYQVLENNQQIINEKFIVI